MTTQLLGGPPKKLRSRAKARAGILALQEEAQAQRAATVSAAQTVLEQLQQAPEHRVPMQQVLEDSQQPERRVREALEQLASSGQILLDTRATTVTLADD